MKTFILISFFIISLSNLAFSQNAKIVSSTLPGNVEPGRKGTVTIVVQNNGDVAWQANKVWLSSTRPNQNNRWGVTDKAVTTNVPVNGTYTFNISVTAPTARGSYDMGWQMRTVSNGLTIWFGNEIYQSVTVQYLPTQFLAKLYSEALGRGPDQGGWQTFLQYFGTNGCNLSSLQAVARGVFTSSEYSNLGYDNEEKVLTFYRAILSRDPDASSFLGFVQALNGGQSVSATVDAFTGSSEFTGLVNQIFSGYSYGWRMSAVPNFSNSLSMPPARPKVHFFPASINSAATGTALQAALNNCPATDTVVLLEKLIVLADINITIPANVTLKTNSPNSNPLSRNKYARFARIARASTNIPSTTFTNLVTLNNGARLQNVFVDGSKSAVGSLPWSSANIFLNGGTNTTVNECRSSNVGSCSPIQVFEDNITISNNVCVTNNLVECYASTFASTSGSTCSDGITNGCLHAIISGNYVIDATDCGIISFGFTTLSPYPTPIQSSQISWNTIVNAGNSAYSALVIDAGTAVNDPTKTVDFSGCTFSNNSVLMGSGPEIHYDMICSCGTRAWFGATNPIIRGGVFSNNSSLNTIVCNNAFFISDANGLSVTGNTFNTNIVNACGLPLHRQVLLTNTISNSSIQTDSDRYSTTNPSEINRKVFNNNLY
jgi:hypothetical protein